MPVRSNHVRDVALLLTGTLAGAALVAALGVRRGVAFAARLPARDGRSAALRGQLRELIDRTAGEAVSDERLIERIRAQLNRPYLSRPGLVDVHARNGNVVLMGTVFEQEVDDLLARLRSVPGIRSIESRLRVETGSRALH